MDEKFQEDLISAYLDGEASSEERAQVESLRQRDPTVRSQLEEVRRLSNLMKSLPADPAPAEFRAAVMQSIERQMLLGPPAQLAISATGPRRVARWLYGSSAFAASAMLLIAVAYYFRAPQQGDIAQGTVPVAAHTDASAPRSAAPSEVAGLSKDMESKTTDKKASSPDVSRDFSARPAAIAPSFELAKSSDGVTAAPARTTIARSQLVFGRDLREAEVGQVVQALERVEGNVSVVTLTVIDRMEGLKGFQSLLARNRIVPDADTTLTKSAQGKQDAQDKQKDDALPPGREGEASSDLVCVYVEAPSEQLAAVIKQLRSEMQFRELRIDEPLALAALDQRTGNQILSGGTVVNEKPDRGVDAEKQGKSNSKIAKGLSSNSPSPIATKERVAKPAESRASDSAKGKAGDETARHGNKLSRDEAAAPGQISVARQMPLRLPQSVLSELDGKQVRLDQLAAGGPQASGSRRAIVARRPQQSSGTLKAEENEGIEAKQPGAAPVQVLFVLIDGKTGNPLPAKVPSAAPPAAPKKSRDNSRNNKDDGAAS